MIFHSVTYFVFLIIVYTLYRILSHRMQNRMLLLASYVFYSFWDWRFLSLILASSLTDYFCSRHIYSTDNKSIKKKYVALSCIINLSILFFFKYFNFFVDNFLALFSALGLSLDVSITRILLPVGISFYTFQSISYTIDVYRKQLKPADNFFDYALYVAFFPQLVAGPIERGKNLLPQIVKHRSISSEQIKEGFYLLYMGLFKKIVLAANFAEIVNPIFSTEANPSGGMVLVAGYAFLFQVYCDFSAYTDFARGTAKLFGIEIMENFRTPYLASNIQEFWNRWHISLTTWIRDYLYYPLAFKRFGKKSIDVRVLTIITFLIMGLWHGAAWNFILWGGFHGLALALYAHYSVKKKKFKKWQVSPLINSLLIVLSTLLTFHICFIGDVFFRATSFNQSFSMLHSLFFNFEFGSEVQYLLGKTILIALPMVCFDIIEIKFGTVYVCLKKYRLFRYAAYYAILYCCVNFSIKDPAGFIYFQF